MKNITIIQYLIICPLVFIAGMIDAIAGGGGLITLPAYLIAGLPPHNAIATNKLSSSMGTATATAKYALSGFIPWRFAIVGAALALAGSNIGANLTLLIDGSVLSSIMLFLLPISAIVVMKSKFFSREGGFEPYGLSKTLLLSALIAFVLGMYDGFYGPGTGTFLILALTGIAHLDLNKANGVTKAINFSSNIAALAVYIINGKVLLPLGLAAGFFSIAGNWIGATLFSTKGAKIAKPVVLTVIGIFFIKVIFELILS